MDTLLHTPPDPKFQRTHYPLPDYLMEKFRSGILRKIESGLASEGFEFRRRRPGLRIQHGQRVIHLWIDFYMGERWWKIMVGHGSDEPAFTYSMEKFGEFNLAAEEIDHSTGVHIALESLSIHLWGLAVTGYLPIFPILHSARRRQSRLRIPVGEPNSSFSLKSLFGMFCDHRRSSPWKPP